jgi:hypothetical protein
MTLGYYFLTLGTRYAARGIRALGLSPRKALLLPIAGWNLESWSMIADQFDRTTARLGPRRVTVLDAGLMRLVPEAATAALDAIATGLRGGRARSRTPVHHSAHSRMFPGSAWAGEALQSSVIKPLGDGGGPRRPKDRFEERLVGAVYPDYGHLLFSGANRLMAEARAAAGRPESRQLRHLLGAGSAEEALARAMAPEGPAQEPWEAEPRAAAE